LPMPNLLCRLTVSVLGPPMEAIHHLHAL
jgi:hypothetical protein